MSIETVFLDAGGVLVYPNWERVADALARRGVTVAPSALAAAEPYAKRQIDVAGTITATNDSQRGWTYFNLVLSTAGVTLSDATGDALVELHAYHQAENLWETIAPDAPEVLASLRRRGRRLVVVSNANGTLHRAFDRLGLTPLLDVVFDSFVEGVEKPDPRFFQIAIDRAGASPETTVHVGDLYHVDVVGARSAGIVPVLLDAAGLYGEADCLRVRTLSELSAAIDRA